MNDNIRWIDRKLIDYWNFINEYGTLVGITGLVSIFSLVVCYALLMFTPYPWMLGIMAITTLGYIIFFPGILIVGCFIYLEMIRDRKVSGRKHIPYVEATKVKKYKKVKS